MEKTLNTYEEMAGYIENYEILNRIKGIRNAIESNRYVLSFMGQFSAGKSRLINNLLQRDILPVHITETTAAVTYIQYGECERAYVRTGDGSGRNIELEEVKKLWQRDMGSLDIPISSIERIDIFLENEILKKGLVLADTPGMNTLLVRHEALALELVDATEEIFYVMGKPMTSEDRVHIRNMAGNGIPITFVRTHMDELKSTEEKAADVMESEEDTIHEVVQDAKIFFISVEEGSDFFPAVSELRKYIGSTIAEDVAQRRDFSCRERLKVIGRQLGDEIDVLYQESLRVQNNQRTVSENKIGELLIKIDNMNAHLETHKQRIREGFEAAKRDARYNLRDCAKRLVDSFDRYLDSQDDMDTDYQGEISKEADKRVGEVGIKLQEAYIRSYDEFVRGSSNEILSEISIEETGINIRPLPKSMDEIIREQMENDMSLKELRRHVGETEGLIKDLEAEIEKLNYKSEDYAEEKEALEQVMQEIKKEEEELGAYIPQYYMDDSNVKGLGDAMRSVGKMLDWAMLLIPAAAYEKAAMKIGQGGAKVAKIASSVLSKIGKMDHAKDLLYMIQNLKSQKVSRKDKEEQEKKTTKYVKEVGSRLKEELGPLGILTIEYWMGMLGEKLDGKPEKREDLEYRNEYEKAKNEINLKFQKQVQKKMELYAEYGRFKSEQEKMNEERRLMQEQERHIKEELAKKENEIRRKAKENAFLEYKREYGKWYSGVVQKMSSDDIILKMDKRAEIIGNQYEERCTRDLINELQHINREYNRFVDGLKALDSDELQNRIQVYNKYLQYLGV